MTTQNPAPAATKSRLRHIVSVEPHEVAALVASFAMFFALLSAYYIVRPVRDEIGVTLGKDALHQLFTVVFFAMIALVPLFASSPRDFRGGSCYRPSTFSSHRVSSYFGLR